MSKVDYREVLKDNESLAMFLRAMAKFDSAFCDLMNDGADFTIKLEIHGNKGRLIHARSGSDGFERPSWVENEERPKTKGRIPAN